MRNMFKVNNNVALVSLLLTLTWTYFTHFSSISIVDVEKMFARKFFFVLRSSRSKVFWTKAAIQNYRKSTKEQLQWSLSLSKVAYLSLQI